MGTRLVIDKNFRRRADTIERHDALVGTRFGRLLVVGWAGVSGRRHYLTCECECGVKGSFCLANLRSGHSRSCGCLSREVAVTSNTTHGLTNHSLYRVWAGMKSRCTDKQHPKYANYGGRGITVCDRWASFPAFLEDMGERPEGTSIDRVDNNGDYEPSNYRWATGEQQARNKRSTVLSDEKVRIIRGSDLTHAELGRQLDVCQTLVRKVRSGSLWKSVV